MFAMWRYFLIGLTLSTLTSSQADESLDTRENADLTLKCRFTDHYDANDFTFYWARWTANPAQFDNVAIHDVSLNSGYKPDYRPKHGIYDLQIKNASYIRDNGRFECRIKAKGTGADVHQEFYNLTVLTPPHPPVISPGNVAIATEDVKMELTCSSIGGSPDPTITWYREGTNTPLHAVVRSGGSKDQPTNATLTLQPRREDDGAKYKCIVRNRAMNDGQRLEATATLNVNYFPRVDVGPENPLRVERDRTAKLECNVDAKPKVPNVRWTRDGRFISSSLVHSIQRVSTQDAGKYTCSADNGLGKSGESVLILDILYPPTVVIESKTREAEEGETVNIRCNVTSNPPPITIEWLKEGSPEFRYSGEVLTLSSVRAEHAGSYICRAVNIMESYGQERSERVGNSTVALLVRHRPGQAFITPNKPIVHVGNGVTLTCSANPPGWPVPQYRWFRDMDGEYSSTQKVLAQGPQYSIPKAHLGNEGKYHCHAVNELGNGQIATIVLEIHQPPQFLAKLQQHMTRRVADTDYAVTCSAKGKPAPSIRWLKDGVEILPELNLYEVKTNPDQGPNGMVTVQSMLKFRGKARPNGNQLVPGDRGLYTCLYENEVNSANSSMQLRIEHEPIVLHQYNKVAFDIRETAEVVCKVQAYPKPEFQWQFGNNPSPLTMSSDGHYEISTTTDNNDIYTSVLRINSLTHADYGEYTCRVVNSLDTIRAPIRLQQKGPPEKPTNTRAVDVGPNYVTLSWDPGFDGGLSNTKFFVSYRRVPMPREEQLIPDCATIATSNTDWLEFDCQHENPCKVTSLDQHQSYAFKVNALNTKGNSPYSNEIMTTTKVSKIPPPLHVTYDPNTHTLGINVGATCLSLVAIVESMVNMDTPMAQWEVVDTVNLQLSGNGPTFKETVIDRHIPAYRSGGGRSLGHNHIGGHDDGVGGGDEDDDEGVDMNTLALADDNKPTVRVKLCLRSNQEHCGKHTNAEIGRTYIAEASALATPTLIAIIVSCIVFALFVGLLLMFCRCKRNQSKKSAAAKDYEMDSVRPSIVAAQQSQPPPPYYPASGLDNKALEHSMDLALGMEDQKSALYATQNGYSYHPGSGVGVGVGVGGGVVGGGVGMQGLTGHTLPGNEWVNMGYIENNYSNSNNGGSVNSQDSLWQVKMPAATGGQQSMVVPATHNNYVEHQPTYGYDPLTHGGYGAVDDYAPYPHLTATPSQHGDEYHNLRNSQNPSRQDYCSDPYASVQKPKKRVDQHLDSPYHDVSGLPNPYNMEHMEQDEVIPPQQHMSLSYDDSFEGEYSSTPNSRNRRVIREIIV
ncbi:muscle M-line assembly protein unc-89 isoform X1 [Bactrocera neohumeralis]|nr:muscle M-line assembly protein unc-89 isoform X1 [Bactrocera neohumeralis]XP_050321108.1 muscle M-line assembly protein unc-89 isoform X1 [Bactrocera neohumeralis]XP_050321109.1 muscle M-line assembly protein unc-89 isoform X1 [Bactrocera neohumeralis]XP_050321110.1 muscle M-line assembly protein unc-89 isoform X1 [Bactrocera neohumeralis]